jgi:hypothetical protein
MLTQVDLELSGTLRGPELAAAVAARRVTRSPMANAPTRLDLTQPALAMTWGDFCVRHPEWRGEYWEECRALYSGGERLLADDKVMKRLFPAHFHEVTKVYEERKRRAHYFPYAGTIIDHMLAGLGTDPIVLSFAELDEETGEKLPTDKAAEWWEQWVTDVTDEAERPADYGLESDDDEDDDEGGRTLHDFTVDVLREALQTRSAWVLVDLPRADENAPAPDAEGADPYLCTVPAEQVIDWQYDDRKRLTWAMIMTCDQLRPTPKDRRGLTRYTFVIWDSLRWVKYEADIDPANPPHADTVYQPVDGADHDFGRVPLERLQLPEGLYAMGKLHSIAREHFNKRCAMSWAEFKSLFAMLYEFLGPEDNNGLPTAEAQTDASRAVNQIRGQGYTQVRGKDDKAEYVGPDPAPFVAARESCNDAMREMHRVMFSMALSANMDKAALQRSGESKEQDNATTAVLLNAFGKIARRFIRRLLVLAALGRGEAPPKSRLTGGEQFDVAGVTDAIAEATNLFNGVPIKSPTFAKLALARLYFKCLPDITAEQRQTILDEIEEQQSAEELMMAQGILDGAGGNMNPAPGGAPPGKPKAKPPADDGGDKPAPKPAGPMYSSKRKRAK